MVLTPGVCASSLSGDAAARPGARISDLQGDGGNSASLPGESTKDTVKTIRAGKAKRSATPVIHPVCILRKRTDLRVPPAPGLPCALWHPLGGERQQASGETRRGNASSWSQFGLNALCLTVTLRCQSAAEVSKGDGPAGCSALHPSRLPTRRVATHGSHLRMTGFPACAPAPCAGAFCRTAFRPGAGLLD